MKRCLLSSALLAAASVIPIKAGLAQPAAAQDQAYEQAEAQIAVPSQRLVLNSRVVPNWTGRGGEFWYRRDRAQGGEYVLVAETGARQPAFDHERLATALSQASEVTVGAWDLNLAALVPAQSAVLVASNRAFACTLADYRCTAAPTSDPTQMASPVGNKIAFARDDNLWMRDVASGEERPLTTDGKPDASWGAYPDAMLMALTAQRMRLPFPPWGLDWSPDGRWLIATRTDHSGVEPYPFLESVPQDGSFRPLVRTVRQPLMGEEPPIRTLHAFEAATGRRVDFEAPRGIGGIGGAEPIGWSADGNRFFATYAGKSGRELGVVEVDVARGTSRTLISEKLEGYPNLNAAIYNAPNVRLIRDGRELIWFSERSGYGHLYRYDAKTGRLLNAITRGDWVVRDIVRVDEERRRFFFTASGREPGNPYRRRLYRVNFDGSGLKLLTPEDADHMIDGAQPPALARILGRGGAAASPVSPDGRILVDTYSTLQQPPVSVMRSAETGAEIARLDQADVSALRASGWQPPEPFVAKAADGKTDLYGAIYWPQVRPAGRIPIIDAIYAGPQTTVVPHDYVSAYAERASPARAALAVLGFAVVVLDARGTPFRSRDFQSSTYGNFIDPALDDHAAVIRQLAERHKELDPTRVGIYGHSFGGYASARAMLRHPDLFSVGVSSAANHRYQSMYNVGPYLSPPDYGGGSEKRPSPTAVAENYKALDNNVLAEKLRGRLLLAYGDMDENTYPAMTLQFIDALVRANRPYDLLYMPNHTHAFGGESYFIRRLSDYFITHLKGEQDPQESIFFKGR